MEHLIDPRMLEGRIEVHLVGVGGNGAQMASRLARLDIAMRALGHPGGLHVTAWDPDDVSESNVGRQLFSQADVGLNKAVVMMHRLNLFYGLDWNAIAARYAPKPFHGGYGARLVISCVDSRAARQRLHTLTNDATYWLDLGNTESTAQVVLGQPASKRRSVSTAQPRLPCVTELYPELFEPDPNENDTPSCSVRVSLASQGLFVNDAVVTFGCQLLYQLLSKGRLSVHGAVMNLDSLRTAPIEVNPQVWRRFGHGVAAEATPPKRRARGGSKASATA